MYKIKVSLSLLIAMIILALSYITAFAATPTEARDSVVLVAISDSHGQIISWGSGFAIGEPGKPIQYIVTNSHVVESKDKENNQNQASVRVYFSYAANKFMNAEVYWKNRQKDLAVLKLPEPTTERKAMILCPIKKINMNDTFHALGYPAASMLSDLNKFDESDISITRGGISKQARIAETNCYLLDLQISEGNSGGPVVNSNGEVVGISTFYILYQAGGNRRADVKSNYAVAIDELIKNIDRDTIPYTVTGEMTQHVLLYIGIGVAVVIVLLAFVRTLLKRKKTVAAGGQYSEAPSVSPISHSQIPNPKNDTYEIVGIAGPMLNKRFDINKEIIIGRDPGKCIAAFPLDTPGVSGVHCEVFTHNGGVFLKDLNSTYGTFLSNGTKLTPNTPVKINHADKFYLGGEDNKFEIR